VTQRDGEEGPASAGNHCVPRPFVPGTVGLCVQSIEDVNIGFASDDPRPGEAPRCRKPPARTLFEPGKLTMQIGYELLGIG
jgi:hypothetical protein